MRTIHRFTPAALALLLASAASALAQTPVPPAPVPAPSPSPAAPAPASSGSAQPEQTQPPAPGRVHLHRPGTDMDADSLVGNMNGQTYVLKGNVVLHSDPKVDPAFAATESSDPLTLSADEMDVERKSLRYVAKGHVQFTQGSRSGRADTATLDEKLHDLDLIGHAHVSDGIQQANSDRMHYNTSNRKFRGAGNVKIIAPIPTATPAPPGTTPTPAAKKKRLGLPI
ncbi:MAG: LptA/OstA family protein [Candidatus Velthaea sp.]